MPGPYSNLILIFFFIGVVAGTAVFGNNPTVIVVSGTVSTLTFLFLLFRYNKKARLRYNVELGELKKQEGISKQFFDGKLADANAKKRKGNIGVAISLVAVLVPLGFIMALQESTPSFILWVFLGGSAGLAATGMYSKYYGWQVEKYKAVIGSSESQ